MHAPAPLYTRLVSTNGAVSLMRTDSPDLPTFAAFLADGEMLDTFTDHAEAEEFCGDARDRMRNGLQWPDPDGFAVSDVHPTVIVAWATEKVRRKEEAITLLPCGCYSDACYCGQYPTDAEWHAMQADTPDREPMTQEEMDAAEEVRNFWGRRADA